MCEIHMKESTLSTQIGKKENKVSIIPSTTVQSVSQACLPFQSQ